MSPLSRLVEFAAKVEAVYGTDPVLAGTDCLLVSNLKLTSNRANHSRPMDGIFLDAMRPSVLGRGTIDVSFDFELRNGATLDVGLQPIYGCLLEACGWIGTYGAGPPKTWTFAPAAATLNSKSVAIECYYDGLYWQVLGCRGKFTLKATPGAPAVLSFAFTGLYAEPAEAGAFTPDHTDDAAPPIVQATTFQPFSRNPTADVFGHVRDVTIDPRANVVAVGSETAATGQAGITRVILTGFGSMDDPGGACTMEIEQGTQAGTPNAVDLWTKWAARTTSASCALVIGATAQNIHTITMPKLVIEKLSRADMDGVIGDTTECRMLGSSGGDFLTIKCTGA